MAWRKSVWAQQWREQRGDDHGVAEAIRKMRKAAAERLAEFQPLTPSQLAAAAANFKKQTARGASTWSPAEWASSPPLPQAWEGLAPIVADVEKQCCLPRAELDVFVAFTGKPDAERKALEKK